MVIFGEKIEVSRYQKLRRRSGKKVVLTTETSAAAALKRALDLEARSELRFDVLIAIRELFDEMFQWMQSRCMIEFP